MNSRNKKWLSLALALSLTGSGVALAAGEQNGRITGKLLEAGTQAALPGVTVTLTSPALIGGAKVIATAQDGYFEATSLPPGEYTVEFSMEGVKPIKRKLVVRQGETSPLNISWNVESAIEETIVVEYESPGTRPESTQSGTVLSSNSQAKLASGRSYQTVTQQVAGVSGGANPDVRGGSSIMNRYMVDGLDITDPVTNTFSSNINFDSIGSVAVITGGMEAQYNSMGGVINLISAQGSDEFHIDASVYGNHYLLSAPAQYGSNVYEGYRPFDETVRPPTQGYQGNVNISGPILKEKLWYNLSYQYTNTQASVPSGPPLNAQGPNREFVGHYLRGKLVWAPGTRSRVTLSAMGDPTSIDFADNNGSFANAYTPFASRRQNQGGWLGTLIWEYFPSDATTIKAQVGGQRNTIEAGPQALLGKKAFSSQEGSEYDAERPRHNNADDGSSWYNFTRHSIDDRYTLQTDLSVARRGVLFGQRHEAQVGFQGRLVQRRYWQKLPGDRTYNDRRGGAGEAGLCLDETTGVGCDQYTETPEYRLTERGGGFGVYVQDRWKPTDWLTIMPGLRFDYGTTRDSSRRIVSQLYGFGPRLGAVVDVTRDQKTIFSASYGRSNETLSLLAAANASPGPLSTTYQYSTTKKQFEPLLTSGGPGGTQVDRSNHTSPHSDEILLSLRRQVAKGTGIGVEYTYKVLSNIWDRVETNYIWDPSGTRIVGYRDGVARSVYMITRPEDNWVKYQSVDLVLDGRPTPELEFYAAYTLSFRYGPGSESMGQVGTGISQFFNPRQQQFFTGYAYGDTRHQLKFQGSYTWKGLSIGPGFTFATGTPLAKRYQTANNTTGTILRSPVGTTPGAGNDPLQVAEFRTPDILTVNARVAYDFEELTGQKFTLIADMFNLFNTATPTALLRDDSTILPNNFGQVSARQQPFRLQLGLRYRY
ncbi:carboxypeptidase regulatory-like domain-containing protein [Archangium sp.]|uniref:carboxypeptidase regulatory-like domain-containing protein n=1 Tax=Archangium sp. TaxID=1872627 RepID=UPI002D2B946C|nr:carboxypeptidase regulatory-like domain-containing protein [Archangium sp.]HYO53867.1 carboxypeptidase regulatory-like domain-containing protein [Archangium sp.]